ncbi:hypothetical protein [Methylobacterium sp. E-046]|uniref:hypothetical protein n=1 Tax=Methylobacterium sp. E-046 TaxID=2836576 RepID=UPI001FB982C8|nr:hypothetical protein [Methylobacterium sp. E-046]MCJ2098626.1 hypothetical protein [Methylobacterium sp. E-046]
MGDDREKATSSAPTSTATATTQAAEEAARGPGAGSRDTTSEAATNGSGSAQETLGSLTERQICEHFLLRNVRYQEDRETYFRRLNRFMSFFTLMSGLGTIAALAGKLPEYAKVDPAVIAAATSTVGALQLVFGFARTEGLHADLRRQFLRLLAEIEDGDYKGVQKKGRALLTGEPPGYFAVNALAYNAAQARFDRPVAYNKRVRLWQRLTRNMFRFTDTTFPRYEDVWAKRAARWQAMLRILRIG